MAGNGLKRSTMVGENCEIGISEMAGNVLKLHPVCRSRRMRI